MSKNNLWWLIGLIILVVVLGFGLSKLSSNQANGPIRIGIATVLSGDFAAAGENMVNAANLAIDEINNNGGINGRKLELVVQDGGFDSKTGLAANQKLINTDGIKYIVGGTASNGTLASAPLINQQKVIYMTPVTGGANVDNAGEYIFRTANSDLLAGKDLAEAVIKLGYKNVATVTENTEYTLDIKKTFEQTIKENGGTILNSEEFQPGTTDFRTLVSKVKASNPQAVLILSQTGTGGAYFIKQSRDQAFSPPFFSDFTFVVNENAKKIVGSFEGIYFADPAYDVDSAKDFLDRYQKAYGLPSLIPFHALATYDAVMMMADGLRAEGDNSEKVHDWLLANIKDYHGLMGTYSLDDNGNSDLGFVIKVMKNGSSSAISL